ncbi:hypothetical protein J4573_30885 [Actinomadura barringtoniae]|uniref:Uncharacterized protein n=1 Tax=Actinomadura barringtoniae TaxID=1427535 RepID=A0A939PK26_9ACTN|nr:hypothetical protein [Actinomadura barringtoniae]MBO2451533.1 hypothetical protein [Actinomadura barringtoniae]
MGLTGKDATATLVTAVSAGLYAAYARGTDLPLIDGARGTAAVLLIVGVFGGCAMGRTAGQDERMPGYTAVMCLLGVTSLVAAVAGLFTGNGTAVGALFATIAVMWLLATVRHAFLPRPALVVGNAPVHRDVPPDLLVAGRGTGMDTDGDTGADTLPGIGRPIPDLGTAELSIAGLGTAGFSAATATNSANAGGAAELDAAGLDATAFKHRVEVSDLRGYGTSKRRVPATRTRRNDQNGRNGLPPW